MFNDLRSYIDKVQELGECRTIEGADPDLEIGAITDLAIETNDPPLLLFDNIKGADPGFRVATNLFTTQGRTALALNMPKDLGGIDLVKAFRDKISKGIELIPPVEVKDGPILQNIDTGSDINILKFPAPKWHDLDGGRYIGTGSFVMVKDPDEGWINGGTYRVQVQDEHTVTVQVQPAHHGNVIRQKYWKQGKSCPVAICCGQAPALFAAGSAEGVGWGISELDYAGGLNGSPIEVVKGPTTGLPIPATAEIVIEGDWVPPEVETRLEGPFGEFHGYFAGRPRELPVVKVNAVLYRNNPIIQGHPPSHYPSVWTLGRIYMKAATLWNELERHITGVHGVFINEAASIHAMPIISLEQQYDGHAMRAAMLTLGSTAGGFQSSVIIIVDEDIDPSNTSEVMWALGTRTNERSFITIPGCWGIESDPMMSPEKDRLNNFEKSRTIILAIKPYHWKDQFPKSIKMSHELAKKTAEKWGHIIFNK
jgi:UbiD family decarboxylase